MLHLGSPTGLYGAERWILALLKHLPKESVASVVGVIEDDPRFSDAELCKHARALGFETVQFQSPGKLSFSAIGKIRGFVKERGIDIIHTHGYKTDIIGLLATAGTQCKIVSTPHGWSSDAGVTLQLYEGLDRLSFYFMDAVVPLSPELLVGLSSLPGLKPKLHIIPNGVDLSEIDAAMVGEPRNPAHAAASGFTIGYIGQLISRKGLDTLIQAFHALGIPDKRLLIIGDGPQREELEKLAAMTNCNDRIEFLGFRDDRMDLLLRMDLFVLPSSLEGIPRCLMEAMGAGIPVAATNIPGCTDLVENEVTGMLFEVGNVAELECAMTRLGEHPELRVRIAERGQKLVREQYSAASMAKSYSDLYAQLNK